MSEYRFKRSYDLTSWMARLLKVAFFIALFGIFVQIDMLFLPHGFSYSYEATGLSLAIFAFVYAVFAVILAADIFLWIGMLIFILTYDDRAGKTLWFVVVLLGMHFGAALYYFTVYRKYVKHNSMMVEVGRAG